MYNYFYDGQQHTDTSIDYLTQLGMDEDSIESLQRDANDYKEQQLIEFIEQRNAFLDDSDWMILRQLNQQQMGLELTMNEKDYEVLLTWRQQLRDMPETLAGIKGIIWPPLPPFLENEFPDYPG